MFFRRVLNPDPLEGVSTAARAEIIRAVVDGDDPIFHGGCCGCIFRKEATTHAGIKYCLGCQYMHANWSLPDRSWTEYRYQQQVDAQRARLKVH